MGPVFSLVIWLIVAFFFVVLWIGSLITAIFGWRRKSIILKWIGGVPLVLLTLFAVLIAGIVIVSFVRSNIPQYVYEDTFHEKPTDDVKHIKTNVSGFGDSYSAFIRFESDCNTFLRLLPKESKRVTLEEFQSEMPGLNLNPPSWWYTIDSTTSEIWLLRPAYSHGERFAFETTLMTYHARRRVVQYYFIGID